jgi:methionine synthase II (cobalamin-independent)
MATRPQVQTAVGAHLVGGLKAPDAETAMRTAAGILGRHLHAVTDGETGDRSQWIFWQLGRLSAVEGIEMRGFEPKNPEAANEDYQTFPVLSVDPSVTALPPRALGYADAAEASYAIFRRLRDEGAIPSEVKFQVSIPTPYATVVAWVADDRQEAFFPVYADAIAAEVRDIAAAIAPEDLVIQYDVAVEFGVLTGQFQAAGNLGDRRYVIEALRQALADVPAGVERGLHLCYGDYKHRHFTVPEDLSLCVEVANGVGAAADFIHMPVDRDTGRHPGYHEPLRDLSPVPGRLALGVIDYEGDAERTRDLVAAGAAGSGGMQFEVATECGMARIDERGPGAPSLEQLLSLHAEVAAPVR